jgi:hypothetical protein
MHVKQLPSDCAGRDHSLELSPLTLLLILLHPGGAGSAFLYQPEPMVGSSS